MSEMSLYNMIAGMNAELAMIVSCILGFRIDEDIPRFRDVFTGGDDCPVNQGEYDILIYTRMGGGNYDHWDDCGKDGEPCPYCRLLEHEKEPWYIGGYNDDYDCTYRTLIVRFTPEQNAVWEDVKQNGLSKIMPMIKELFPEIWEKINESKEAIAGVEQ